MRDVYKRQEDDEDDYQVSVRVPVASRDAAATPRQALEGSQRSQAQLELLRRLQSQGGQADSPGATIHVDIDPAGRVKTIRLDPRLSAVPTDELAGHIATVCAEAFNNRLTEIARIAKEESHIIDPDILAQIKAMTTFLRRPREENHER